MQVYYQQVTLILRTRIYSLYMPIPEENIGLVLTMDLVIYYCTGTGFSITVLDWMIHDPSY